MYAFEQEAAQRKSPKCTSLIPEKIAPCLPRAPPNDLVLYGAPELGNFYLHAKLEFLTQFVSEIAGEIQMWTRSQVRGHTKMLTAFYYKMCH